MGEVVKLDKKARDARRKAEAARATGGATGRPASSRGRPIAAIVGGLILVLMIVVTFFL